MSATTVVMLFSAMPFVIVHVFGGRFAFLTSVPQSFWLSAA